MIDLGPVKEVMAGNIFKLFLLGCALVAGNLYFKMLGKKLKDKKKR